MIVDRSILRGEQYLHVEGVLHLLQITDTHLMAHRGGRLLNVDTDESALAVINLAVRNNPDPDALLITGDMAGDGAATAYERLENYLKVFNTTSFWLPG